MFVIPVEPFPTLEAITSPSTIILRPPEKLVLEVRATGGFRFIEWGRNGAPVSIPLTRFAHFGETYVTGETTVSDLGLYEVGLAPLSGQAAPSQVEFFVVEPGM